LRCELIIDWSKAGGSFIVQVPELPACMADGASDEEAVANAQAVSHEWTDTARSLRRPIPGPRGKPAYA
jgi:predicted RNase H-like HicB family nuclease